VTVFEGLLAAILDAMKREGRRATDFEVKALLDALSNARSSEASKVAVSSYPGMPPYVPVALPSVGDVYAELSLAGDRYARSSRRRRGEHRWHGGNVDVGGAAPRPAGCVYSVRPRGWP
jgi:hypothetical protein